MKRLGLIPEKIIRNEAGSSRQGFHWVTELTDELPIFINDPNIPIIFPVTLY